MPASNGGIGSIGKTPIVASASDKIVLRLDLVDRSSGYDRVTRKRCNVICIATADGGNRKIIGMDHVACSAADSAKLALICILAAASTRRQIS